MSNHLLSRYQRGSLAAALLCAALALTGCGSSNDDPPPQAPPDAGAPTPPPAAADSFFAYVMARVGSLLDDSEPESIDAVTETKPENTEPEPVG